MLYLLFIIIQIYVNTKRTFIQIKSEYIMNLNHALIYRCNNMYFDFHNYADFIYFLFQKNIYISYVTKKSTTSEYLLHI